jgi:ketosteroid isomerase-like protein
MTTTSIDLRNAVSALDAEFIRNANAGDAAALTSAFYAEDAVLLAPGAPICKGRQAIQSFWQGFIGSGVEDVWIETTEVTQVGDLGYGIGSYACTRCIRTNRKHAAAI